MHPIFFTFGAKKVFNHLNQTFIKVQILLHLDLKCHIQSKTNTSGYVLSSVLCQLSSDLIVPKKSNLSKSNF